MDQKTRKAIESVASRTGLKVSTVVDLIQNGWAYHEEIKKMPRFEQQGPEKATVDGR